MDVEVRQALLGDAAAIASIHVRASEAAYRGLLRDEVLDGHSVEQRESFWRERLTGGESPLVFVAEHDGEIVGFCGVAAPSPDEDAGDSVAEIDAIHVNPDVWRAGIGRALMDAALTRLRGGHWRSVTLWVLSDYRPARDFYARFGLEPDGAETVDERSGRKEIRLRASLGRAHGVFDGPGDLSQDVEGYLDRTGFGQS
jgi:GNAT superfamily N-acetyltransferase